jgi:hypothetical protein
MKRPPWQIPPINAQTWRKLTTLGLNLRPNSSNGNPGGAGTDTPFEQTNHQDTSGSCCRIYNDCLSTARPIEAHNSWPTSGRDYKPDVVLLNDVGLCWRNIPTHHQWQERTRTSLPPHKCWKVLLDLPRPPVCWVGRELCQDPQS